MRTHDFLEELEKAFLLHDFSKAFTLLSSWITFSHPGEPDDLLWQIPESIRPKAALMIGDILSNYPDTLLGYPILTYADHSSQDGRVESSKFELHNPTRQPHEGLTFLGWLPPDATLPLLGHASSPEPSASLHWAKTQGLVAVFQCNAAWDDPGNDRIADDWWADLFYRTEATIAVSAGQLLPLPNALEAARLMHAGSVHVFDAEKSLFLTQQQHAQTLSDSRRFFKDIQNMFGWTPEQNNPCAAQSNT